MVFVVIVQLFHKIHHSGAHHTFQSHDALNLAFECIFKSWGGVVQIGGGQGNAVEQQRAVKQQIFQQEAADGEQIGGIFSHWGDDENVAGSGHHFQLQRFLHACQIFAYQRLVEFFELSLAHGFEPIAQHLVFQEYFVNEDFHHVAGQFAHIVGQNQLAFVADNVAGHINKRAAEALFLDLQFQIVFGVEFGDGVQRLFQVIRNFQCIAFNVQIF